MKQIIYHCIHGFTNLEMYGKHPGIPFFFAMVIVNGFVGAANGGFIGFLIGTLIGLVAFGSMLLYGSYDRSKDHEKYYGS